MECMGEGRNRGSFGAFTGQFQRGFYSVGPGGSGELQLVGHASRFENQTFKALDET